MHNALIGLTLLAATAAGVTLYPAPDSRAGTPSSSTLTPTLAAPAAATPRSRPRIEVVFALDTTGSMGGLIAAAKDKIWSIAASLAQADPAPEIRIGLVAYRDRGDEYVTRVVDLSSDLDAMYAALMDFRAAGGGDGPEAVNQALADAIDGISWSGDDNVYRTVFLVGDAPPHMDYQGERTYPEIVQQAKRRGIVVNAIQCGSQHDTRAVWQHIAALAQGDYIDVAQDGNAVALTTPYDSELARLATAMDDTRLFFGDAAARERAAQKEAATTKLHAAAPAVLARRAGFNASAAGAASFAGDDELVEAVTSGRVDLAVLEAEALPAPLAAMSAAERAAHVGAQAKKRAELKARIATLAAERDAWIEEKLATTDDDAASLDTRLYDTVRRQAAEVGLRYEAPARH
ncbi:MAG: VWA domain-containing protein [Gammaproteobacteria bacterium]